jgi:hypothetical protein
MAAAKIITITLTHTAVMARLIINLENPAFFPLLWSGL